MAEPLQLFTLLADLRALIGAIAIALICTVAPYLLYTRGLQDVDAGQASILATLEPLVAAAIGIFIFGESLTTAKILGMILILSSIFILNTAKNNVKNSRFKSRLFFIKSALPLHQTKHKQHPRQHCQ